MNFRTTLLSVLCLTAPFLSAQEDSCAFGVIDDSYEVNAAGAYNHIIPIQVAPGVHGLEPGLSLMYDSRSGISSLGYGWDLSGLSKISRTGNTYIQHGRNAPVTFSGKDAFLLDGQYLTCIAGDNGKQGSLYHTESENFFRIEGFGQINTAQASVKYFLVKHPNGLKYYYGNSEDSRLEIKISDTQREVLEWNVSRVEDAYGNYMIFQYEQGNNTCRIKSIQYTGNTAANLAPKSEVVFSYEEDAAKKREAIVSYISGVEIRDDHVLKSIGLRTNGTYYKYYRLYYDTEKKHLKRVREESTDGASSSHLCDTRLDWYMYLDAAYRDDEEIPFPEGVVPYTPDTKILFEDMDGDGLEDLLYFYKSGGTIALKIFERIGKKYILYRSLTELNNWAPKNNIDNSLTLADIDGNGLPDIVTEPIVYFNFSVPASKTSSVNSIYENSKSNFKFYRESFADFEIESQGLSKGQVTSGELTGDFLPEILIIDNDKKQTRIYGYGSENKLTKLGTLNGPVQKHYNADLRGAGAPSFLVLDDKNNLFRVQLSGGDVKTTPVALPKSLPAEDIPYIGFMDLNQDGNDDLTVIRNEKKMKCWINNGVSFIDKLYESPQLFISPTQKSFLGHFSDPEHLQLMTSFSTVDSVSIWDICYSGSGLQFKPFAGPAISDLSEVKHGGYKALNVAGSSSIGGFTTLRGFSKGTGEYNKDVILTSFTKALCMHKMAEVVDGFKNRVKVVYTDLRIDTIYTRPKDTLAASYGYTVPAYPVVRSIKYTNGLGNNEQEEDGDPEVFNEVSYSYSGLVTEIRGRGLAGFRKFTITDHALGIRTQTDYEYQFPLTGKILRQQKRTLSHVLFFLQKNKWEARQYQAGKPVEPNKNKNLRTVRAFNISRISYLPVLVESSVLKKELDNDTVSSTVLKYSYNKYGQTDTATTSFGDGSVLYAVKSFRQVDEDLSEAAPYFLGLVETERTFLRKKAEKTEARTSHYEYNLKTGSLIKKIRQKGNAAYEHITSYEYDNTGNLTTQIVFPGTAREVKEQFVYTDDRRFMREQINALGYKTLYTYEPRYGSLVYEEDPNGLWAKHRYDKFGQLLQDEFSDGKTISYRYTFLSGVEDLFQGKNSNALYKLTIQQTGAKPGVIYFDKMGREVSSVYSSIDSSAYTQKTMFAGNQWQNRNKTVERKLLHYVQYDERGNIRYDYNPLYIQVVDDWVPVPMSGSVVPKNAQCVEFEDSIRYKTSYTYDALNRLIEVILPDGNRLNTQYAANKKTEYDPKGQQKITWYNAKQEITSIADDQKNHTNYLTDLWGNVTQIVSPDGSEIRMKYDLLGRKTQLLDPNLPTVQYEYDAFDRIVKETNGTSVVTLSYDKAGRLVQKSAAEGSYTWKYDQQFKGKTDLVTDPQGNTRSFVYNGQAKTVKEVHKLNNVEYTTSYTYDSLFRLSTQTFPSGYTVRYGYINNIPVKLTELAAGGKERLLWKIGNANALGQVLNVQYGNGLLSSYSYNAANGLLQSIKTKKGSFAYKPVLKGCKVESGVNDFLLHEFNNLRSFEPKPVVDPGKPEDFIFEIGQSQQKLNSLSVNKSNSTYLQDLNYSYDAGYNLISQADLVSNTVEGYLYDNLNRLTKVVSPAVSATAALILRYEANGNISFKSDQGLYEYDDQATQRVKFISAKGKLAHEFLYDQAGNMVEDKTTGLLLSYTSFNKPSSVKKGAKLSKMRYGIYQEEIENTLYSNDSLIRQVLRPYSDYEIVNENGKRTALHYITMGGRLIAIHYQSLDSATAKGYNQYVHTDHLGSVNVVTDEAGNKVAGCSYSGWGERTLSGQRLLFNAGFTAHDQVDDFGLINMGGRYYFSAIGRFVSADPFIQSPLNLQSLNRYSYVMNSPLNRIDPDGFWSIKKPFDFSNEAKAVSKFASNAGRVVSDAAEKWVELHRNIYEEGSRFATKYQKQIIIIAAAAVITVASGGTASGFAAAMMYGALTGAAISGGMAAYHGGNFQDVLNASFNGAVNGAASGALFYGVGSGFAEVNTSFGSAGYYGKVLAHGTAGGVLSESTGGDFKSGFLGAAVSQALTPANERIFGTSPDNKYARIAFAGAVGGASAYASGGNVMMGATTATFSRWFNDESHLSRTARGPAGGPEFRQGTRSTERPLSDYELDHYPRMRFQEAYGQGVKEAATYFLEKLIDNYPAPGPMIMSEPGALGPYQRTPPNNEL